jgi:predicted RNA binding protein YcfA (HicA-like mRNA interferase family)
MSKIDKLLEKMRNNPRDWGIETLQAIAERYGIVYRQPGTSHVTFRAANGQKVTVPAHKPIKSVYIKQFIALIEDMRGNDE